MKNLILKNQIVDFGTKIFTRHLVYDSIELQMLWFIIKRYGLIYKPTHTHTHGKQIIYICTHNVQLNKWMNGSLKNDSIQITIVSHVKN